MVDNLLADELTNVNQRTTRSELLGNESVAEVVYLGI